MKLNRVKLLEEKTKEKEKVTSFKVNESKVIDVTRTFSLAGHFLPSPASSRTNEWKLEQIHEKSLGQIYIHKYTHVHIWPFVTMMR